MCSTSPATLTFPLPTCPLAPNHTFALCPGVNTLTSQLNPPGSNLSSPDGSARRYILYLPTYNQATAVAVGVDSGATLVPYDPLPPVSTQPPVVWYGVRLLQPCHSLPMQLSSIVVCWCIGLVAFCVCVGGGGQPAHAAHLRCACDYLELSWS